MVAVRSVNRTAHGLVTHEHHPRSREDLASGPDGSRGPFTQDQEVTMRIESGLLPAQTATVHQRFW